MVTNLAKMTWERLTLFKQKNKCLPKRVLVYRDGVSEVMTTEYTPDQEVNEIFQSGPILHCH
jgi:hypothetical protein